MHFASPYYLICLLLIPMYIGWSIYKKKSRPAIQVSVLSDIKAALPTWYKIRPWLHHGLIIFMLFFFSITLARPQGAHEKQNITKEGIDIIVALDVSESMLAEDLTPNRLEAAKQYVSDFVKHLKNDRLGIVIFSGQAFTQSPLTFDYNILTEYIDRIDTRTIRGVNGTAVGDAILAAVNRFKKSEDRSKVLILLTDGDSNRGARPDIAARKAREENIKIYTIGIGKENTPLYTKDMFGRKQVVRNRDGSIVTNTFNEAALKQISEIGDGQYFRATDNERFSEILDEIAQLEKREIKINTVTEYSENFMPFLYALVLTFLTFILINVFPVIKT